MADTTPAGEHSCTCRGGSVAAVAAGGGWPRVGEFAGGARQQRPESVGLRGAGPRSGCGAGALNRAEREVVLGALPNTIKIIQFLNFIKFLSIKHVSAVKSIKILEMQLLMCTVSFNT